MFKRIINILKVVYYAYIGRPSMIARHAEESWSNEGKESRKDVFPYVVYKQAPFSDKIEVTYYRNYEEATRLLQTLLAKGRCAWLKNGR